MIKVWPCRDNNSHAHQSIHFNDNSLAVHSTGGGQLTGAAELGGSNSPTLPAARTPSNLQLQNIAKSLLDSRVQNIAKSLPDSQAQNIAKSLLDSRVQNIAKSLPDSRADCWVAHWKRSRTFDRALEVHGPCQVLIKEPPGSGKPYSCGLQSAQEKYRAQSPVIH